MNNPRVEDEYQDVLQNLEFAIVSVYRQHPDLSDHQVDKAMEGLVRTYQAELKGRSTPSLKFGELDQKVFDAVHEMCELRLGRSAVEDTSEMRTLTVDEIILCLKRIRSSISTWTKDYGRQGYLNFVSPFLP